MVQNKQIRNFLFLLSGIVLLFCGSIPNFAESVIALLRGLLSFINLGWIGTLLIISRVLLILGGTALSVIGAIFMIQDATAAKRQPNWVVLGCTGGGVFFGLLSLVPLLFWIGIFGVAALVVAMVFAYKDVVGAWRNPVSKIASFMMIGSLVAFFDRFYNIPMGLMETHWLAGLCGIAAFIYLCVWKGKLAVHLDEAGRGHAVQLLPVCQLPGMDSRRCSMGGCFDWLHQADEQHFLRQERQQAWHVHDDRPFGGHPELHPAVQLGSIGKRWLRLVDDDCRP